MPIEPSILQQLRNNDVSLVALDLSEKGLNAQDMLTLYEALRTNTVLTSLDLNWNQIGDKGATALAQNKTLTSLNLWGNKIGDEGAKALAENKTLTSLNLGANQIGAEGAETLAQNKTLTSLYLRCNPIGNEGAKALAQNKTLTSLSLGSSQLGAEGATALAENKTLTWLEFRDNNISFAIKNQLEARLEENQKPTQALINACQSGQLKEVSALLAKNVRPYGQYIQSKLSNYDTLLHLAVRNNNPKLLDLLLPGNLDKNTQNNDKLTYTQLARQLQFTLPAETSIFGFINDWFQNINKTTDSTPVPVPQNQPSSTAKPMDVAAQTSSLSSINNFIPNVYSYVTSFVPSTQDILSLPTRLTSSFFPNAASAVPPSTDAVRFTTESMRTANHTVAPGTSDNYNNPLNTLLNTIYAAGTGAYDAASYITLNLLSYGAEANNNVTTPTIPAETIAQLKDMGLNISENMTLLSMLKTKQDSLSQSISAWEVQAKQNNIIRAELEAIAQDLEVKCYYQMMKSILERTLMAAIVIASGEVASSTGIAGKLFDGLCTLAGIAFPTAAPALGFIKMSAGALGSTITYREMQRRLRWIELAEIPEFAAMLARRLSLAQKSQIIAGTSRTEQSTFDRIEGQCNLLIEELKSGQTLSDGEKRAILDAKELFEYMLSHDKPDDMSLSGRTNLLIQQIVGGQYVYTLPTTASSAIQTNSGSTSTTTSTIIPVPTNTTASQHEIDTLRQEMAQLKAALESEKQSKHEQAQQLQTVYRTVQELQARQSLLPAQTTRNTNVVVGNGSQVFLQQQAQEQTRLNSSSAPGIVLSYVYERVKEHDTHITHLTEATLEHQDYISSQQKTGVDGKNKNAGSNSGSTREEGKNKSCCMM